MRAVWLVVLAPLLAAGCLEGKGEEGDVPEDGKLDSFRSPTDHGAIAFGAPQSGKLTAAEGYHTWTFSLSGAADVKALTSRKPHYANVDTVLYLYKKGSSGSWGSYIARNDDDGRADWSSVTKSLDAGDYRVLVKGFDAAIHGSFNLTVECSGVGCAPTPPACLFGATFYDITQDPAFHQDSRTSRTNAQGLSTIDAQRAVLAMHESTHTDVMTADDAFGAADQNEIVFTQWTHVASGRTFTSVDYGAGDNTYGAIFVGDTADIGAAIHDGDLYRCAVQ